MRKMILPVVLTSAAVIANTGCSGLRWQVYQEGELAQVHKKDLQLGDYDQDFDELFVDNVNQKFVGEMFELCYMQRLFTKKYKSIYECVDSKP